jgi:hypothetical protein
LDTDLNPLLAALLVGVVIPILLWVEAVLEAPRWFRILAHILIVLWMLPLAANAVTEIVCSGGWYNGYGNCLGPFDAEFYNKLLILFPLMPIASAIYVGAVVARIFEALTRTYRSRKDPKA